MKNYLKLLRRYLKVLVSFILIESYDKADFSAFFYVLQKMISMITPMIPSTRQSGEK